MDDEVKSAAQALNDRSAGLDFEVSVVSEQDLEDGLMSPKVKDSLLKDETSSSGPRLGLCGCFTLAYYQPYFDVDTADVQMRLLRVLVPFKKNPAFHELTSKAPDAYGPFWVSTTLVFCLASCSNFSSFLEFDPTKTLDANATWKYDFTRIVTACTLVEVFLIGLPLVLWMIGKYVNVPVSLSFLVCLYGYSLTIFIPACIICVLPADALDWVAMLMAMALSLVFLVSNLSAMIKQQVSHEKMLPLIALVSAIQLLWTILIKLLFF